MFMPKFPPPREPDETEEEYNSRTKYFVPLHLLMYVGGLVLVFVVAVLYRG